METITPARVPAGVQAGGQFAAVTHHEPGLSLVPAPVDGPDFDYDFEKTHGARLRKALEELPAVTARAAVNASRVSDLMRDSYSVYWADGTAPQTRPEAVKNLEDALGHLPRDRRGQAIELIRFAVHEEMKHRADPEHVLNAGHPYELLIDRAEYDSEDEFRVEGQDENRERWELLADTAAFHAVNAGQALETLHGAA